MRSPNGIVTLLSDFGAADPYVGIMRGMVLRQNPKARVFDLCHEVPAHDVETGAFFLASAIGRFPPGTVHVAVVDPGVGSARGFVAAHAAECYWVGPDNGLLDRVIDEDANSSVRSVDVDRLGLRLHSRTFHGRDVFAPLGGMLSGGRFGFPAVGTRLDDYVPSTVDDSPRVLFADHFGNLISSIPGSELENASAVEIAGRRIPVHGTYADVEPGELLALVSSYDLVEVAAREARASDLLGVGRGATLEVLS